MRLGKIGLNIALSDLEAKASYHSTIFRVQLTRTFAKSLLTSSKASEAGHNITLHFFKRDSVIFLADSPPLLPIINHHLLADTNPPPKYDDQSRYVLNIFRFIKM